MARPSLIAVTGMHAAGSRPSNEGCAAPECNSLSAQGYYSMFITMLPHLDPMMFYLATQQNAQTQAVAGAEKTAVAWCVLQSLA